MSAPMRVLSLGAGVQSTAVARLAIHGVIPPIEHAIFADVGGEPAGVYTHLAELTVELEAAGVEVHVVKNTRGTRTGNLGNDFLDRWLGRIKDHSAANPPLFVDSGEGEKAGMIRRQCTRDYKIKPINWKLRELVGIGAYGRPKEVLVERLMGISLDEVQRMRDSQERWARNDYPLVDLRMTRWDCLRWLEAHGYPRPPRSACTFCPYHSDDEWRRLRDETPDDFAAAVRFDHELRADGFGAFGLKGTLYVHNSCKPLDEVDFSTIEDAGQGSLFGSECEGMCGT